MIIAGGVLVVALFCLEELQELPLARVRALTHVPLARALTPSGARLPVRSHPNRRGPASRRLERLPIRRNLDGPIDVLIDDLLRNSKRAPTPIMRNLHFGPPPLLLVMMALRRLIEAGPRELDQVGDPVREVLIRLLARHLLEEGPHDMREVRSPR